MKVKSKFAIAITLFAGLACSLLQPSPTSTPPPTVAPPVAPTVTPTTAPSGPPHEGVFIEAEGEFIELKEEGFTGGALISTASIDYPVSPNDQPTLVVWRRDVVNLDFLSLQQANLGGHFLFS